MVIVLSEAQLARIRAAQRQWMNGPPPCGISHADVYNPCLPERVDSGPLMCVTCGLRQRLAITA